MISIDFKNNTKTSERGHLTTSYLPEVTVQNHVLDSFSQNIYQFAIKSYGPYFQQQQTHICYFMRNKKLLPKYLIHEKFKMSAFLISEKAAPKMDKFFNFFLPYIQRVAISVSQSQTSCFSVIYYILKLIFQVSYKPFGKSVVKNTIIEISKKMEQLIQQPII